VTESNKHANQKNWPGNITVGERKLIMNPSSVQAVERKWVGKMGHSVFHWKTVTAIS
jgi:hypothetical protein